jgi:hypothetical protein
MDNIVTTRSETKNNNSQQETQTSSQQPQPDISSIVIHDENTALNVMVSFLNLAQKRGAFNMQESAKLWECIQTFVKK